MLGLAVVGTVAAVATPARAALPDAGARRLSFYNLHTGERLNATYWAEGRYIADELGSIDRLLRDFRTGEVATMDPGLMDLLHALQGKLGSRGAYHVISGYRSAHTNDMLRKASDGVAANSLHAQGKAIDIRVPGVDLRRLREAALTLRQGGVGYYPKSDFVHVDVGRVRAW